MTDSVFPINDDPGDETILRAWIQGVSNALPYVQTEFAVTASTGLSCNVSPGVAYSEGLRFDRDTATNVGVFASSTNFVFVTFNPAAQNEVVFHVDTDGSGPATPSVLLAEVETDSSGVTEVRDRRNRIAISRWGDPQ